jgi:hypothetical protein
VLHERRRIGIPASLLVAATIALAAPLLFTSAAARLRPVPRSPVAASSPPPADPADEPADPPAPPEAEPAREGATDITPSPSFSPSEDPADPRPALVEIEPIDPAPDDSRALGSIHVQTPLVDRVDSEAPAAWPPEPSVPLAAPLPAPGDTELAWAEIGREAERIAADRDRLDALKPALLDEDVRERRRLQHNERLEFLDRLRRAAADTGAGLEALAGETVQPRELQIDESPRQDALARSRQLRAAWITRLRALGTPEPAILDEIARALARNANARGGPRTRLDALRRASAELLAVPVGPPPLPLASDRPSAVHPSAPDPSPPPRPSTPSSSAHGRSRRRTSG